VTFINATGIRAIRIALVLTGALWIVSETTILDAQRRGGGGGRSGGGQVNRSASRSSVRSDSSVNRSASQNRDIDRNVNRDVNRDVNRNREVDRNVNRDIDRDIDRDVDFDRDIDIDRDIDRWGHPVARGVAAASIAVGTYVAMLPSGCSTVVVDGIAYSECGSTWYQPYYRGTDVEYVVVSDPH
jgi:hypothetical protein